MPVHTNAWRESVDAFRPMTAHSRVPALSYEVPTYVFAAFDIYGDLRIAA